MSRSRNSRYWERRFTLLESANNREANILYAELERGVQEAQRDIARQIRNFHNRFARGNNMTMAEARRLLNTRELEEFRWGIEEYTNFARTEVKSDRLVRQLENASIRVRVTRLEALQLEIQQTLERMFGNQLDIVDRQMKRLYLKNYYHSIFEVQRGFQIGWDIAGVDNRRLEKIMQQPWVTDDRCFSERIWFNRDRLVKDLQHQLIQDVTAGRSPEQTIAHIAKRMNTSKHHAGTLAMTESAYFSSLAQGDAFDELDVEQFQIIATLDLRTSELCQDMDMQIFPQTEFRAGVTAPPFHPNCRTTTIPYFEDNPITRWARNADGKTTRIPGNITYREWFERFVHGGEEVPEMEIRSGARRDRIVRVQQASRSTGSVIPGPN